MSRNFLLLVFFMNQFPPSPRVFHLDRFEFFRKFAEIFASQGAQPVSTTPVANFSSIFACVVDTGGNFATGVNDTGGKFATGVVYTGGSNGKTLLVHYRTLSFFDFRYKKTKVRFFFVISSTKSLSNLFASLRYCNVLK